MPKANRKCVQCGIDYYVCYSCVKLNSYKKLFCSAECYRESLAAQNKKETKKHKKVNEEPIVVETSDDLGVCYDTQEFPLSE